MTTNPKPIRRAYYSPDAAKTHGSSFYRSLDGKEVEVTCVSEGLDEEPYYNWSDKIDVGLVAEFIRLTQNPLPTETIDKHEWPPIFFADDPIAAIQEEICIHKLCADALTAWGNVMMKKRMPKNFGTVLAAIGGRLGCLAVPEKLIEWHDANPLAPLNSTKPVMQ